MKKIPIAISSCLLGNKVRFDGGHKQSKYCLDTLNDWFEYQPICPEMGIGMPAPRPPIRLIDDEGDIRVVQVDDQSFDVTDELKAYAENKLPELDDICGYIVIRNSPSCGMERVKVYHKNGNPAGKSDRGVYIKEIMKSRPELPVEEEGRLQDVKLRENFITRVFAYQDFKDSVKDKPSVDALVKFHSRYKYLVMAHNYADYKKLGQLVANNDGLELSELIANYELALMECLKKIANPKSHSNVLYHILGYLKEDLQPEAKKELVNVIEQYRNGSLTLIAPVTLLNHYIKQYGNDYIAQQAYLNPHPIELGLRNYI
ncbi:YbgA family protein [Kangiella spongicola]|uniref:DUF1722 domain-containing protein n=1 Tax=Kangiella spongicola TaxID=796379 RepID=A0A318D852_9GAMM|nr:DUF523 and DUF1722 domain-containing protein [Kangiella spongicola]MBV34863.1 hypothetical protein [Rickettsiales bacterium]PXF64095.1 hypothetical protein DL796_02855 [Kangiella spongicola]